MRNGLCISPSALLACEDGSVATDPRTREKALAIHQVKLLRIFLYVLCINVTRIAWRICMTPGDPT